MFWIDQNYYIFEVFVGLKSEITNILVTKNVIYVKLPDIQQLLEEYPLPCPALPVPLKFFLRW